MHWFTCNDNERGVGRRSSVKGSIWRAGRFFLYGERQPRLKAWWHFFVPSFNYLELSLKFGGESSMVSAQLVLPWLAFLGVGIGVPRRWLSGWMYEDRVFALKLGYIGDIAWIQIAHNEHAIYCGMLDYYSRMNNPGYTKAQLWPGYQIKLRWPRVLDWTLGREQRHEEVLETHEVKVPMDGREYPATVKVSRHYSTRARWPWRFRESYGSWIDVPNPPRFAGKGENSYDCGDDGIWGKGSRETQPAAVVGDYIKAVLTSRERYGMPSEMRA